MLINMLKCALFGMSLYSFVFTIATLILSKFEYISN